MPQIFRPRPLGALSCLVLSLAGTAARADDQAAESTDKTPTVTVTGSPLTQDADALANIVDSVSRDDILRHGGANLADALADVPGVSATSFAAGASRPVIRGFDADRVRVLEDGIGSFDVSDIGPDHGVPIDPLSSQRIEVVRGAGTLRYGSQAIGGVVNSVDNRVPFALPDQPLSGELNASYGSNADARQGAGEIDARLGQFALHADGYGRHTDDYDIPGGTQGNSFFHGDGYAGGGSYFFGADNANHIGIASIHTDQRYGIPSDTTYIDMQQTKELLRSSFAVNAGALQTITVDGGYANYQHTENEPDGSVDSTFRNKEWEARSEALFGAVGPLSRSALGVQLQGRNYSALGEDASYLLPTLSHNYAGFAFTEAPLSEALRLQAGARVESASIDGTAPHTNVSVSRNFTPVSGSLGLVFDASQAVRLGLTLSSAGRTPAVTELYAQGGHDGPDTYETGDPSLRIERANSLEGTLRVRTERARFEGSLWGAKFQNYVYGALTGEYCDDDGDCQTASDDDHDLKQLDYTQAGATFYGAEGKSNIALWNGAAGSFSAKLLADWVHATLSDGGGPVPRVEPWHVGGGIDWDKSSFDGGFLLKYTGARHDTAAFETPTSGYASLDAQLGWRPLDGTPGLEVMLVGHNLTNRVERNAVALNKDDVVLPGRDVRLTLRATF
ncbi:MAG: TonB-dependent receptor [Solimonas sp.]